MVHLHLMPTSPREYFDLVDYTITQIAVDDWFVYVAQDTLRDLSERRLRIHRLEHPPSSLDRLFKYSKRGFTPDTDALHRLASVFR
jgi:hypothetical protein